MYTDVLIPTDGSDHVESAIQYGLDLAQRYDATVHALHVVDSSPIERQLELTALETEVETVPDTWYDTGDTATRRGAEQASDRRLDAVTEVRRGIPAREIASYITDNEIDLVCMGTRGHTGLDRLFLGSVTRRIVRIADVPVLCVTSNAAEGVSDANRHTRFERILVPTDGSKPAQEAVVHALDLARTYGASLHALYVVDRRAYASRPGNTWDELQGVLEESGDAVLEELRARATRENVSIVTELRRGVPHRAIQVYSDERDVDLIVMGAHGRSGITGRIVGSVTDRVLRSVNVPVLTVRETVPSVAST